MPHHFFLEAGKIITVRQRVHISQAEQLSALHADTVYIGKGTAAGNQDDQENQQANLNQYRCGTAGQHLVRYDRQGEPLSVTAEIIQGHSVVIILLTVSVEVAGTGG